MIVDACFYNGEENILEIRLETLSPFVDKFILLESPRSHSQIKRELEFPKQQERFAKFKQKIHYYATDYCINTNFLLNDWQGRLVLQDILVNQEGLKTTDIILNGDLDEIPKIKKLKLILEHDKELKKPYTFLMDNRVLCFDLQYNHLEGQFPGTMLLKGQHLQDIGDLCHLRQIRKNPEIEGKKYNYFNLIASAGFHLGYCAGLDRTIDKFRFYSHANETISWNKSKEGLTDCIKNKIGFTPDKPKLYQVEWEQDNFPSEIYFNPSKYKENLSSYYEDSFK